MEPRQIVKRLLTTEKSTTIKTNQGKYSFEVDRRAGKHQIKNALEQLFKIEVESIRTVIMPGKTRRMGRYEGKSSTWKKAIVKVKGEGQIAEFDNL